MSSSTTQISSGQQRMEWRNVLIAGLGAVGMAGLTYLVIVGQARMAITLTLMVLLLALMVLHIRLAILAVLVYLVFMGDLRRILIPFVGWSAQDPLLLIGPIFAIVLCAYAWASRSVQLDTPLARWTLALMAVMVLQIFNPKQGGLIVGVGGVMFLLVPLLWYWIGRTYATPAFMKTLLYKVVLPLAVLAMMMGYYQSFYGYLPYQMQWYDIAGYGALGQRDALAPISFFSSGSEHAMFLTVAMVLCWAAVLHKKRGALVFVVLLLGAVFLAGSRGPLVKALVAAAALWAILGKDKSTWIARGGVALLLCLVGLSWSLSRVGQLNAAAPIQKRMERQAQGLLNPLDERESTIPGHVWRMMNGYRVAFRQPLGSGLGSTTKAAYKFTGTSETTEVGPSDVFRSTGLVGGVIYHIMIVLIILSGIRYWFRTQSLLAMAILGVLAVTFLGWIAGGKYALYPLVWLCIGALDRLQNLKNGEFLE